jgi:hypothetical protein
MNTGIVALNPQAPPFLILMDERDRDKFYSPPTPPVDDDEELELEPLDPAIANAEQRRAAEVAEQVRASIDIDQVYREAERNRSEEIVEGWIRNFKFRPQIKHVAYATAALTVLIAVSTLGPFFPTFAIMTICGVAGLYLYLSWQDSQQQAEAAAKREKLYAKRRAAMQPGGAARVEAVEEEEIEEAVRRPDSIPDMYSEPPPPEPFRLQFSMRSLLILLTIAAVGFGLIHFLGGPGPTATILGFMAVAGLLVHALGFDPPQAVVLVWWLILAMYVVLSIAGAV